MKTSLFTVDPLLVVARFLCLIAFISMSFCAERIVSASAPTNVVYHEAVSYVPCPSLPLFLSNQGGNRTTNGNP